VSRSGTASYHRRAAAQDEPERLEAPPGTRGLWRANLAVLDATSGRSSVGYRVSRWGPVVAVNTQDLNYQGLDVVAEGPDWCIQVAAESLTDYGRRAGTRIAYGRL
jgi:hypothetical protein